MSDENLSRGVSRKKRMWWCLSRERERGRGQRKRDENKGADLGEGCQHRAVVSFFHPPGLYRATPSSLIGHRLKKSPVTDI